MQTRVHWETNTPDQIDDSKFGNVTRSDCYLYNCSK